MNFDMESLISIGIYIVIGSGLIVLSTWLNFRYKMEIVRLNKEIETKQNLLDALNFEKDIPKKLESNKQVDEYLNKKLEILFSSFIYKNILHKLKQFSTTIAEPEKITYRKEFIEFLEFNLTEDEKLIFEKRYKSFKLFKFICIDFFNIKLTKLELLICHKVDMKEEEFSDFKLFMSLYDTISSKDIKSINQILETINQGDKA